MYGKVIIPSVLLLGLLSYFMAAESRQQTTHWITWKNYTGQQPKANPNDAIYVLDGNEVGKGDEGFNLLLNAVSRISSNSKVVIFPDYMTIDAYNYVNEPNCLRTPPFPSYRNLYNIARRNSIGIYWSPYNNGESPEWIIYENYGTYANYGECTQGDLRIQNVLDTKMRKFPYVVYSESTNQIFAIPGDRMVIKMKPYEYDLVEDKYLYQFDLNKSILLHKYSYSENNTDFNTVACDVSNNGEYLAITYAKDFSGPTNHKVLLINSKNYRIITSISIFNPIFHIQFNDKCDKLKINLDRGGQSYSIYTFAGTAAPKSSISEFVVNKESRVFDGVQDHARCLFYNENGNEIMLDKDICHYGITTNGKFVVWTNSLGEIRAYRTDTKKVVFAEKISSSNTVICYDSIRNRFLFWSPGNPGTTFIRALVLPANMN